MQPLRSHIELATKNIFCVTLCEGNLNIIAKGLVLYIKFGKVDTRRDRREGRGLYILSFRSHNIQSVKIKFH